MTSWPRLGIPAIDVPLPRSVTGGFDSVQSQSGPSIVPRPHSYVVASARLFSHWRQSDDQSSTCRACLGVHLLSCGSHVMREWRPLLATVIHLSRVKAGNRPVARVVTLWLGSHASRYAVFDVPKHRVYSRWFHQGRRGPALSRRDYGLPPPRKIVIPFDNAVSRKDNCHETESERLVDQSRDA
jgi:hypothetical protein